MKVREVSKRYRLGKRETHNQLREKIVNTVGGSLRALRARVERTAPTVADTEGELWALRDVSFDVEQGEVLGIVGRNGGGKSTLMKVLARITEPTTGKIELYGRVGSLLEVGTGFHPELTGRENIFLNGAILGMKRAEIAAQFDEIVDFSGIEEFIDTPVKRYSSGMYVRLAFAVAAHLQPEILLIDEVLAVGDSEFQRKCLGKMGDVARAGRTVLFISHDMTAVQSLCAKCLLIKSGKIAASGPSNEVIGGYMASMMRTDSGTASLVNHPGRRPGLVHSMTSAKLNSDGGQPIAAISMGAPLSVSVSFECGNPISPVFGVVIKNSRGGPIVSFNNKFIGGYCFKERIRQGTIVCQIDSLPLMPGTYLIDLWLDDGHQTIDVVFDGISFEVLPANVFGTGQLPPPGLGDIFMKASFTLTSEGESNANGKKGAANSSVAS
jgi:lipopolysaccharide transport system ATP-binding protein